MVLAVILAHLVGDFVLQWDRLAVWKSRAVMGALAHGMIVLVITALFALPLNPAWWPWVLFIGGLHTLIDAAQPWLGRRLPLNGPGPFALVRLVVDQTLHALVILGALTASGYLAWPTLWADLAAAVRDDRALVLILGYVFISLPAWILVEFLVYGLVQNSAPDFAHALPVKYVGTLERWLMTTFVLLGQYYLVPVVALPRLLLEGPQVVAARRTNVYVAELLLSAGLAVATGLALGTL
jgi:hypothetical protein